MQKVYKGIIVDAKNRRQFTGEVIVDSGKIIAINESDHDVENYILPGLIDAHVHIESSMTVPSSFAPMVVTRGTVAVVTDPHEIANVLGEEGIDYMINDAKKAPLKCYFGVPSCVPATPFEASGATLNAEAVDRLLARNDLHFLCEMMNFPGVIFEDKEVVAKIHSAQKYGKVIDGHIPGIFGDDLKKYVSAGITTDHECFTYEEAVEKIKLGMKVLIREGSAAKNFEALYGLVDEFPNDVMLCTDDSHPDTLLEEGHIDKLFRNGLKKGLDIYNLIQVSVLNPIVHYGLNVGKLEVGDQADFIVVDNLEAFNVQQTFIDGECVYDNGRTLFQSEEGDVVNKFNRSEIDLESIKLPQEEGKIRVIVAQEGELITGQELAEPKVENGCVVSNFENDILKMVVLNRYENTPAQIGFIKNIGLKKGAIASSIAHDSHNIIAVGTTDEDLVTVINKLIENKGGIVVGDSNEQLDLPLEIAGLMTRKSGVETAARYKQLEEKAHEYGTTLKAPFMTIAFMSLLVIPDLKLGDKGLFDVKKFDFVDLFVKE